MLTTTTTVNDVYEKRHCDVYEKRHYGVYERNISDTDSDHM